MWDDLARSRDMPIQGQINGATHTPRAYLIDYSTELYLGRELDNSRRELGMNINTTGINSTAIHNYFQSLSRVGY